MEYKLRKNQLTFSETFRIVTDAVDACFEIDENGIDIGFTPECKQVSLQCAFYENYIDSELDEDFDKAFATYMSVDIDKLINENPDFNSKQWLNVIDSVDQKVDFRKQKMLQKNIQVTSVLDEEITKFATVLTDAVQKLPLELIISLIQTFMDKINSMSNINEDELINAIFNKNQSMKNRFLGYKKRKNQDNPKTSDRKDK